MARLLDTLPQTGRVEWIGVRAKARIPMEVRSQVAALPERGLDGDRSTGGKRQVSLIQAEHLPVIAALCGIEKVAPEGLRRNLVISGINLLALHNRRFTIGDALLEGTGLCQPCSRMEDALGAGGFNAMRGHGGVTARVLRAGLIRQGDAVRIYLG